MTTTAPDHLAELLTLSRTAPEETPEPGARRSLRELYEADIARISGHLAAMRTHVFPIARRVLGDGPARVDELVRLSHAHETLLQVMHNHLRGDVHARALVMATLQHRLRELVAALQAAETDLADALEATLTPDELRRLADRYARAAEHGPTRPHPHVTHRKGLRRLSFQLSTALDHTLDTLESRVITAA